MIGAMLPEERAEPELLVKSPARRRRVADACGKKEADVSVRGAADKATCILGGAAEKPTLAFGLAGRGLIVSKTDACLGRLTTPGPTRAEAVVDLIGCSEDPSSAAYHQHEPCANFFLRSQICAAGPSDQVHGHEAAGQVHGQHDERGAAGGREHYAGQLGLNGCYAPCNGCTDNFLVT